jgi:hypothetical protein
MDWISKAANERNAIQTRRDAIARAAPVLWKNICEAIGHAVKVYGALPVETQPIEFSGPANHTVFVTVFEGKRQERGAERDRVNVVFNQDKMAVEVSSPRNGTPRVFPINLNSHGHACLMDGAKEISVEEFTELALRAALFPDGEA